MTEGKGEEKRRCDPRLVFALCMLAVTAIAAGLGIVFYKVDQQISKDLCSQPPEYTMAITGVAGLDDVAGDRPTLSPVFNLTLRINNTGDKFEACIPVLSTALVFYGDALLGKGSLEPFCAEANGEREGRVRAWGQDVVVPRFLRDQLACELGRDDAAVDVTVKTANECDVLSCHDVVLACKAKIGGGPPCQKTRVQYGVIPRSFKVV